MARCPQVWLLFPAILFLVISVQNSQALLRENGVKSGVFLSPKFVLEPGSVSNKFFHNVDFPRGHIAIKDLNAEVFDEAGNPIPLYETYLHHWLVLRYYQRKGVEIPIFNDTADVNDSDTIIARNSGLCEVGLSQYFGLGSETRKTATYVPDPYGIEVGNLAEIPDGFEEQWLLNVHAIDTRGVEDRLGCLECRCDLYNVTEDEYGQPLKPNYVGGYHCCYDETRCRLREGFNSARRSLYMRYTIKWVDWDNSIVPVKIYMFDVTDGWERSDQSRHDCLIEYDIESCSTSMASDNCNNNKRVSLILPTGGDVIYAVGHQHVGGIGTTLYGEDGRVICKSVPIYGEGKEAGNEAGYVVGMSTCYPQPGSVKISERETLILESNYNSAQRHTGVMGMFYILVADPSPKPESVLHAPFEVYEKLAIPNFVWVIALFGTVVAIAVYGRRTWREDAYQSIVM